MPYTFATAFPKGLFSTNTLSNTAVEVLANTQALYVTGWVLVGGAASHIITFRAQDGSPDYFSIRVPANVVVTSPCGFFASQGLEVISGDAAGDVTFSCAYVTL